MINPWITYRVNISALGSDHETHKKALRSGHQGVRSVDSSGFNGENWFLGKIENLPEFNRYNALLLEGLSQLRLSVGDSKIRSKSTLFIVSSTKGNLEDLPNETFASTRELIKTSTNNPNTPIIVSNACISGVIAINLAANYVRLAKYEHVFVIGIDVLSDFVINGFQSLFALSAQAVRPFDKNRNGINIGESCSIVEVSREKPEAHAVLHLGGSSSNDANHISGPSRTGEGLVRSIEHSLKLTNTRPEEVDFISAHGTGTLYNDEMESIAFSRTHFSKTPLNSLKGYFGHTLGAAGVLETIVSLYSMEENELYASIGFEMQGTSEPLNIIQKTQHHAIHTVLKTASGFGGGNATLILQKS